MAVELLERGLFGEVYNMGSEEGVKIYDLVVMLGVLMGWGRERPVAIQSDPSRVRPWEIWHLQSDNAKLYSVIDYRPQVSLEDALKKTVRYFRDSHCSWGW
jgi:nucleoside-diphosphate-sugar epimerase